MKADTRSYTVTLSEEERKLLVDLLEDMLRTTRVEEHRTDAFRAKEIFHAREVTIESLLEKVRAGN